MRHRTLRQRSNRAPPADTPCGPLCYQKNTLCLTNCTGTDTSDNKRLCNDLAPRCESLEPGTCGSGKIEPQKNCICQSLASWNMCNGKVGQPAKCEDCVGNAVIPNVGKCTGSAPKKTDCSAINTLIGGKGCNKKHLDASKSYYVVRETKSGEFYAMQFSMSESGVTESSLKGCVSSNFCECSQCTDKTSCINDGENETCTVCKPSTGTAGGSLQMTPQWVKIDLNAGCGQLPASCLFKIETGKYYTSPFCGDKLSEGSPTVISPVSYPLVHLMNVCNTCSALNTTADCNMRQLVFGNCTQDLFYMRGYSFDPTLSYNFFSAFGKASPLTNPVPIQSDDGLPVACHQDEDCNACSSGDIPYLSRCSPLCDRNTGYCARNNSPFSDAPEGEDDSDFGVKRVYPTSNDPKKLTQFCDGDPLLTNQKYAWGMAVSAPSTAISSTAYVQNTCTPISSDFTPPSSGNPSMVLTDFGDYEGIYFFSEDDFGSVCKAESGCCANTDQPIPVNEGEACCPDGTCGGGLTCTTDSSGKSTCSVPPPPGSTITAYIIILLLVVGSVAFIIFL